MALFKAVTGLEHGDAQVAAILCQLVGGEDAAGAAANDDDEMCIRDSIYTARIALDNGKDKLWLMELWGMRSDYPARLLMEAARKTTSEWCSQSLLMCQRLDQRMKSEKGIDSEGELKLLLMRLAQGK